MIVTSPSDNGVTLIDNSFIDHYMADANGEFVKIYLYLVRCACSAAPARAVMSRSPVSQISSSRPREMYGGR